MSHRSLRLGALALLAAMAIWPRAKSRATAAELAPKAARAHASANRTATHRVPAPAPPAATPLVAAPPPAKPVVATNEPPQSSD